jgi:hypothetical protein
MYAFCNSLSVWRLKEVSRDDPFFISPRVALAMEIQQAEVDLIMALNKPDAFHILLSFLDQLSHIKHFFNGPGPKLAFMTAAKFFSS